MAKPTMDPLAFLRKTIEEGDPDLLRAMMQTFAEALMSAAVVAQAYIEGRKHDKTRRLQSALLSRPLREVLQRGTKTHERCIEP